MLNKSNPNVLPSTMFIRDNIEILRGIDDGCIDLIYLDPPFNSKHNYAAPIGSKAAGAEFKDMWSLDDIDAQWISMIAEEYPKLHAVLIAVPDDSDRSYLVYMAVRLLEMHRILKSTGSIYLHCDQTMGAWLKIVLDSIFGKNCFRNEIIWAYTGPGSPGMRQFNRKHDTIFWYNKGKSWVFNNESIRIPHKQLNTNSKGAMITAPLTPEERDKYLTLGKVPETWWPDFTPVGRLARERTGYPTQKPLALLERIVKASSNEGDWVLDPFCGCATTCIAAHMLGRKWIGIDISPTAEILVRKRIDTDLGADFGYSGIGEIYEPITRTDIPLQSGESIDPRQYKPELYGVQEGYCEGCKVHFEIRNLTVDHIIPKSKGGQDKKGNLQLLCQHCNSTKGDRDMSYLTALWSGYNAGHYAKQPVIKWSNTFFVNR